MGTSAGQLLNLFFEALAIQSPVERELYLHSACGHDEHLRDRLRELLLAYGDVGDFLEGPLPTLADVQASLPSRLLGTADRPGSAIGPYRLLGQLGSGGMGVVYEAQQTEPVRRRVALKIVKPGMDTQEVLARFEAERQALALMDHPHIARVLDAGATDAGRPYFVMELVGGTPITDYCDRSCLGTRARLQLFVQVCQAVQHAHQKGVIHRDIKPSNVLVTELNGEPVPKVIDFGVAKALHQRLSLQTIYTRATQMVGTPLYMSPEQADRGGVDIDTRTDVYSLGVLLYELLVGTTPFDRDRLKRAAEEEVRRIIREEDPPRPSYRLSTLRDTASTVCASRRCEPRQLTTLLRGELDWIVMKALEKDRSRRYAAASALAADVERYLNDEPVEACPPSRMYRARKFARRYRRILTAGLLVAAALLVGSSIAVLEAVRATDAETLAAQQRDRAQASEANVLRLLYAADVRLAATARDQNDIARMRGILSRQLPQEGQPDLRGFEWYFLWRQTGVRSRTLLDGPSPLYFACFSPDERWLAIAGADATIHLFDAATMAPAHTIDSGQSEVNGLAFSPDARTLASAGDDGSIALWDPDTGAQRLAFHAHDTLAFQVAWSPEGDLLISCANEPVIRLWDPVTGASRGTLELHSDTVDAISVNPQGLLAAASDDHSVSLWRLDSRKFLRADVGPMFTRPNCVALSPDGRLLADGRQNAVVTVRDLTHPEQVAARHVVSDQVLSLAFSPDSHWLAVGDDSGDITLFPVQEQPLTLQESAFAADPEQRQISWHAHEGRLYALAFSPDGQQLVTAAKDGRALVWSLWTNPTRQMADVTAKAVAFTADGRLMSVADQIRLHTPDHLGQWRPLDTSSGPWVWVTVAAATGTTYARSGAANAIHAWDAEGNSLGVVWEGDGPPRTGSFAVSPAGQHLAVQNRDANGGLVVDLIDVSSQRVLAREPFTGTTDLAFSPDGRWLAFSPIREFIVMDVSSGIVRHVLDGHRTSPRGVAFSPDGRHLATVGGDRALIVWNLTTGEQEWSVVAHGISAIDVAFSPDGRTLATIGGDGMLRFWRWSVQRLLLEVKLPPGQVRHVEFSPDGRRLACHYRTGEFVVYDASPVESQSSAGR